MRARFAVMLALGLVMLALGAFVASRPLWTHAPLTGTRWLDMAFAVVFLLRGWLNVRTAVKSKR